MKSVKIILLVILLSNIPQLILAAKKKQDDSPGRYKDSIEVRVAEVEVFVTDKKGNPVKGLTRKDFKLFENKIPRDISNFFSVEGGVRIPDSDAPLEGVEDLLAGSDSRTSEEVKPPLNLIIYVDNLNIRPFSRARIFDALRTFLDGRIEGNDRVMVVSFNRHLQVRQPFTTDLELVSEALDELERISADASNLDFERRDLLAEIWEAEYPEMIVGRVENYAQSLLNDLKFTLGAMKYFVGALGGIQGRKALLYVSDGLPMTPAEEMFYALEEKIDKSQFGSDRLGGSAPGGGTATGGNTVSGSSRTRGMLLRAHGYDATNLFEDLTAYAGANKVTFYTVEAAGLGSRASFDVAYQSNPYSSLVDDVAERNMESSLKFMADQTGGLSFTNTNNFEGALEMVFADMDSFYSLGFKPVYGEENPYFKVKVKMKKRGLKVRYRKSFVSKTIDADMADGLRSTLIFGQPDNPLGVRMAFGVPSKRGRNDYIVPLVVGIPMEKLFFMPKAAHHEGNVRLFLAAKTDQGWMSTVARPPLPPPIQVPNEYYDDAMDQYFYYRMNLAMRGGPQTVAVGVRDDITSITSYSTQNVAVEGD